MVICEFKINRCVLYFRLFANQLMFFKFRNLFHNIQSLSSNKNKNILSIFFNSSIINKFRKQCYDVCILFSLFRLNLIVTEFVHNVNQKRLHLNYFRTIINFLKKENIKITFGPSHLSISCKSSFRRCSCNNEILTLPPAKWLVILSRISL